MTGGRRIGRFFLAWLLYAFLLFACGTVGRVVGALTDLRDQDARGFGLLLFVTVLALLHVRRGGSETNDRTTAHATSDGR